MQNKIKIGKLSYSICEVLMLPTQEDSCLFFGDLSGSLHYNYSIEKGQSKSRHLYVLCDDEIKESDWYITKDSYFGYKINRGDYIPFRSPDAKKIIASTDRKLNLSNIPVSFIEQYVAQFNNGNQINSIAVPYHGDLELGIITYNAGSCHQDMFSISILDIENIFDKQKLEVFKSSKNTNFLEFIYDRLVHKHGEDPDVDYMYKLKEICDWVYDNVPIHNK